MTNPNTPRCCARCKQPFLPGDAVGEWADAHRYLHPVHDGACPEPLDDLHALVDGVEACGVDHDEFHTLLLATLRNIADRLVGRDQ